jgi:hypothetical protein
MKKTNKPRSVRQDFKLCVRCEWNVEKNVMCRTIDTQKSNIQHVYGGNWEINNHIFLADLIVEQESVVKSTRVSRNYKFQSMFNRGIIFPKSALESILFNQSCEAKRTTTTSCPFIRI